MKVILLQNVPKVGKQGEIVDVSDGYAHNFLIARKLASPATEQGVHAARTAASAETHRKQVEKADAVERAKALDGKRVRLTARSGDTGKLFGAITGKEVADAIEKQLGTAFEKRNVELPGGSIKQLGEYQVTLRVYAETTAQIVVEVVAQ